MEEENLLDSVEPTNEEGSVNFYEETTHTLKRHNKTWDDVLEIGNSSMCIDKDEFIKLSKEIYYDGGYGLEEINTSLYVVGDNWWLERHEYDGMEWWEYKERPYISKSYVFGQEAIDNIRSSYYSDMVEDDEYPDFEAQDYYFVDPEPFELDDEEDEEEEDN